MSYISSIARAKINLFLHVNRRRVDGYHAIESLVSFADVGDKISLEMSKINAATHNIELDVTGEFSSDMISACPNIKNNLIYRSINMLLENNKVINEVSGPKNISVILEKNIPVSSGIGGGSADAAMAAKLLLRVLNIDANNAQLSDVLGSLGADVPMCIYEAPLMAKNIGDDIVLLQKKPPEFPALLVNPMVQVSSKQIYQSMKEADFTPPLENMNNVGNIEEYRHSVDAFIELLKEKTSNNMQRAAIEVAPVIAEVIELLQKQEGCLLARMSGSGATCFALFNSIEQQLKAASNVAGLQNNWWLQSCKIG